MAVATNENTDSIIKLPKLIKDIGISNIPLSIAPLIQHEKNHIKSITPPVPNTKLKQMIKQLILKAKKI